MSTKYVESEARIMSLVLIEGIAEIKRLLKGDNVEILSVDQMSRGRELKPVGAATRNAREPKTVFVMGSEKRQIS